MVVRSHHDDEEEKKKGTKTLKLGYAQSCLKWTFLLVEIADVELNYFADGKL